MLNDSAYIDSSHSSTNETNIVKSYRSEHKGNVTNLKFSSASGVEEFIINKFPTTPLKRRTRSQTIYYGDEMNTLSEHNKQLFQDLIILKKKLNEKDAIINNLNEIRNKLENEIQDLSASLFEEAYSIANSAKAETIQAEKLLKEANGKIDVLQAEVKALKELVLTSTPSTPNKHLHPHLIKKTNASTHSRQSSLNQQQFNNILQSSSHLNSNQHSNSTSSPVATTASSANLNQNNTLNLISSLYFNGTNNKASDSQHVSNEGQASIDNEKNKNTSKSNHKRVPSYNEIKTNPKSLIDKIFQTNSNSNNNTPVTIIKNDDCCDSNVSFHSASITIQIAEFDQIYFQELVQWKETPELNCNSDFMKRIYSEDILPCLNFHSKIISNELLSSIESNIVCIEDLTNSNQPVETFAKVCGLSNTPGYCQYKIKLSETSSWIFISKLSRNRVISVCDFFSYLRYIKNGLVKCEINEIYWNIIELRKKMSLSRLGL